MKILVVSQYYWPEPFRITDICEGLRDRGHEIDVLTSVPNIPEGKFYDGYGWFKHGEKEHNGVKLDRVNVIQRGRDKPLRLALNCASFAINSLFHLPKFRNKNYDAVFVFNNSPVSAIYPAKVFSEWKKIPYLVFVLDIWPDSMYLLLNMPIEAKETLFRKISFKISRWLYSGAQTLLISSKGMRQKLAEMNLSNTIEYFPNYAEPMRACADSVGIPSRVGLGFSDDDIVIGFAGNVGKAQGLEKVVEAAAKLKDSKNVKFLIVGDGSELLNLRELCKKSEVADSFVFTGWVDGGRVSDYISLCDVMLACLKDNEVLNLTLPAKVQTYMDAQKPVLSFMNGAGSEVVSEAECGFTARAEDSDSLCRAIEKIAECDTKELERLGMNAKKYCREHFDRNKIIDSLERYLLEAKESYNRK
ncbi:MAG: glycosyltransferase family 4 protein [Oscillospiraceae bacterium]